jgi:alkyl hydroperoxide reductase subunit AhpC
MRVVDSDIPDFEGTAYFVGKATNVKLSDFGGGLCVCFRHGDFTYIDATEIATIITATLKETRNNFTAMPLITDPAFKISGKYGVFDEGF